MKIIIKYIFLFNCFSFYASAMDGTSSDPLQQDFPFLASGTIQDVFHQYPENLQRAYDLLLASNQAVSNGLMINVDTLSLECQNPYPNAALNLRDKYQTIDKSDQMRKEFLNIILVPNHLEALRNFFDQHFDYFKFKPLHDEFTGGLPIDSVASGPLLDLMADIVRDNADIASQIGEEQLAVASSYVLTNDEIVDKIEHVYALECLLRENQEMIRLLKSLTANLLSS